MPDKIVYFGKYCIHCEHMTKSENESPCSHCLKHPVNVDSHKPVDFKGDYNYIRNPGMYDYLHHLRPYLWVTAYDHLDYDFANKYYISTEDVTPFMGGCSSIRKQELFGRNLDWTYDDLAEFVVIVFGIKGVRYGSIGIAGSLSHLTEKFVQSGEYDDQYRLVPFQMLDGINTCGVCASMNVVPTDESSSNYIPWRYENGSVCSLMLIRHILDNYATAREAVEDIQNYIRVYFPKKSHEMGYETHYLIADPNDTYILEFKDNHPRVIRQCSEDQISAITNFHLYGTRLNSDGTVYTPETMDDTHNAIITNNIHPFGSGLERWNYIMQNIREKSLEEILHNLTYTRSYPSSPNPADPAWYTEFVGHLGTYNDQVLTVASRPEEFENIMAAADDYYIHRSRTDGGKTWHTTHRSIYNMLEKTLRLQIQENDEVLNFML